VTADASLPVRQRLLSSVAAIMAPTPRNPRATIVRDRFGHVIAAAEGSVVTIPAGYAGETVTVEYTYRDDSRPRWSTRWP
jgi:hypothetical protein